MLQKLAGRLKWEKTGGGIHVEIPARRDWLVVGGASVIAAVALFGIAIASLQYFTGDYLDTPSWMDTFGFLVIECLAWSTLLWNIVGRTNLLLDPREIKIVRRTMGVNWNTRTFATHDVRNLRYLPSSGFRLLGGYTPSVFCFEAEGKTRKFASGISDIEAFALINGMLEVYEFPRDRALDYIGMP